MIEDCKAFHVENGALVVDESLTHAKPWDAERLGGHDFWLTRNGHERRLLGRGLEDGSKRSTHKAAQVVGTFDLYFDDDGKIYAS